MHQQHSQANWGGNPPQSCLRLGKLFLRLTSIDKLDDVYKVADSHLDRPFVQPYGVTQPLGPLTRGVQLIALYAVAGSKSALSSAGGG
jgi:hypothetical protein